MSARKTGYIAGRGAVLASTLFLLLRPGIYAQSGPIVELVDQPDNPLLLQVTCGLPSAVKGAAGAACKVLALNRSSSRIRAVSVEYVSLGEEGKLIGSGTRVVHRGFPVPVLVEAFSPGEQINLEHITLEPGTVRSRFRVEFVEYENRSVWGDKHSVVLRELVSSRAGARKAIEFLHRARKTMDPETALLHLESAKATGSLYSGWQARDATELDSMRRGSEKVIRWLQNARRSNRLNAGMAECGLP